MPFSGIGPWLQIFPAPTVELRLSTMQLVAETSYSLTHIRTYTYLSLGGSALADTTQNDQINIIYVHFHEENISVL